MATDGVLRAWALIVFSAALLIGPGAGLASDEEQFPHIHGEILIEIQNDWTYRASDNDSELSDLYTTIEPAITIGFTPQLSLEAGLGLEPVLDLDGHDRAFKDEGLYAEQLFLQYATDRWGLRAGKFNPDFGIAWDAAPGVYGVDFAEDYEITERMGVGGFVQLENDRLGIHRLTADLFFLDKSFLCRSGLKSRGHVREAHGGLSNTGDLRSFTLTLSGEEIPGAPGLAYHLGFSRQRGGHNARNEQGQVAALTYGFRPLPNVGIDLLTEYVYQSNAEGADQDRWYLTQSAELEWLAWNTAASFTRRDVRARGGPDGNDYLFQLSVGYEFNFGLAFNVGWRYAREEDEKVDGLGVRLSYAYEF
jgi:hypothetical protein